MYFELKNVPIGSENFYWYQRGYSGGRQVSKYIGKTLPASAIAAQKAEYEANRKKEADRRDIELEIKNLKKRLDTLNN